MGMNPSNERLTGAIGHGRWTDDIFHRFLTDRYRNVTGIDVIGFG